MRFENPWALLLLAVPPALFLWLRRRDRPAGVGYTATGDLEILGGAFMTRLRAALPWVRLLVLALCVVALARPQWGQQVTRIYRDGIAIVMVVDVSSSMGALDLQIGDEPANRLDVVKETFRGFIEGGEEGEGEGEGEGEPESGREGDLIGMVTFARFGDNLSPLTLDHDALLLALDEIDIVQVSEEDGTAIGDALAMGAELLQRAGAKSKVMILLTDGSNNAGATGPVDAAAAAKALGIRIHAIGAGTRGVAMTPVRQGDDTTVMVPTQVFIDERMLAGVAEATGGRYFRATDGAALREIYAEIDRLEKSTNVAEQYQRYVEGFPALLLCALLLLCAEAALVNTRLRALP